MVFIIIFFNLKIMESNKKLKNVHTTLKPIEKIKVKKEKKKKPVPLDKIVLNSKFDY